MESTIYLAGGCFWGVQGYFDNLKGVFQTCVGYANSIVSNPTYEQVCSGETQASECLEVIFDDEIIPLFVESKGEIKSFADMQDSILLRFLSIIDPFSINRQGNDIGTQYRSGIYTIDSNSLKQAQNFIKTINKLYGKQVAIEVSPLQNFYKAENYHQKYLQKNPNGYCHIDISKAKKPLLDFF
ncbi:peptide-methionine (S)-S-oxide reductase MsrA [Helicobacter saguini]|uniref:Peptide methionine sulfoxide reductase MsrA n=1 Tax=Helicobacter saguini TaxID=1548018 RepID=A0A347VN37_9HELI|nr:peptide-methionine (S)-S-oxide reductase MsrA [Helicobacter saguini]MWV61915.1 peptide-methionine (S)-S-oxide reductase MsrA [Helicobacter saguini]MWV67410.1 peptide-methionine (S)-S-oxide reductase MsrA [Helicobacter saguini]MWV69763.1 peptide-methionine (S)-S-oxide reductase MsrA [Helicobacter saguini]MWV73020.1 peptide-methionine (S)-S-oxide reductase MsrA [Helicobacter saguini]TLD95602.1 peptide-methionine (S)-S-oxide reductase [Helicobacter saguini]